MKKLDLAMVKKAAIFLGLLSLMVLVVKVYRPFIDENSINDFHLADYLPKLLLVPMAYSLILLVNAIQKKEVKGRFRGLGGVTLGILTCELLLLITGEFDFINIITVCIGAFATYLVAVRPWSVSNA